MAEPSRKNSGLEQTAKSASGRSALRRRSISRLVPTGTVDLVQITVETLRWGELLDRLEHEAEIGMSIAAAHRRADREKHEIGIADRWGEIRREGDAPHAQIAVQKLVEARLVDRYAALAQSLDLARSLSTQVTVQPNSEKQAAETRPT